MKGKLGRLLGVFEVSFLPKLAEQSAHVTAQRSKPQCVFKHLSVSPPPSDISPAKPGPEAPDVRLRVDSDRNAGGLGGLGQHRYAAAPSPIFTDATRRARSGSSFTSAQGAVIYVQAYRLHGSGGVWGVGGGGGGAGGCRSGPAILAAVCHSCQLAHEAVTWAWKMHFALCGYLSKCGGDEVHIRTLSACKRSILARTRNPEDRRGA